MKDITCVYKWNRWNLHNAIVQGHIQSPPLQSSSKSDHAVLSWLLHLSMPLRWAVSTEKLKLIVDSSRYRELSQLKLYENASVGTDLYVFFSCPPFCRLGKECYIYHWLREGLDGTNENADNPTTPASEPVRSQPASPQKKKRKVSRSQSIPAQVYSSYPLISTYTPKYVLIPIPCYFSQQQLVVQVTHPLMCTLPLPESQWWHHICLMITCTGLQCLTQLACIWVHQWDIPCQDRHLVSYTISVPQYSSLPTIYSRCYVTVQL